MVNMSLSADALAMLNRDPDFNTALKKTQPSVGDVHVSSAGPAKRKPLTFLEAVEEVPTVKSFEEILGADAVAAARPAIEQRLARMAERRGDPIEQMLSADVEKAAVLKPHKEGGAHVPFPYDPQALDSIPPAQMRRFFGALTSPDELETRRVPIKSLVSMQPRVSAEKVEHMRVNGYDKLPTVIRHNGKNYLADGNHRAAASLLDGETSIDCKYCRLSGADESLAKIEDAVFKFVVKEADADQQLIFGWASIVMKGDLLVIDKQGDMILPEELERAAYDFMTDGGTHGHMHADIGTGRPIESMVFTKEKQEALGIVIKDADSGEQIVGWWTGFKVDDPKVWARHKAGELPEFSIGGASMSLKME